MGEILKREWLLAATVLPLCACLTTPTHDVGQEIETIRGQLAQLQRAHEALEAQVAEFPPEAGSTPGAELAGLEARITSLAGETTVLRRQLDDTLERIESLAQEIRVTQELAVPGLVPAEVPAATSEAGVVKMPYPPEEGDHAEPSSPGRMVAAEATYHEAYADFSRGRYGPAISGFEDFLRKYPQSELADNARFWIAESYFVQGDFDTAADQYGQVVADYAHGDRVPAAYLRQGFSLLEMNRTAEAVVLWQHLMEAYPSSEEAAVARDRLREMGLRN